MVVVASELSYALQTGIYFLEFGLQMVLMSSSLKGGCNGVFLRVSVLRVFGFRDLSKHRTKKKQANDRSRRGLPWGELLKANVSG